MDEIKRYACPKCGKNHMGENDWKNFQCHFCGEFFEDMQDWKLVKSKLERPLTIQFKKGGSIGRY
jgi:ribosomal protein L37AE/L43A